MVIIREHSTTFSWLYGWVSDVCFVSHSKNSAEEINIFFCPSVTRNRIPRDTIYENHNNIYPHYQLVWEFKDYRTIFNPCANYCLPLNVFDAWTIDFAPLQNGEKYALIVNFSISWWRKLDDKYIKYLLRSKFSTRVQVLVVLH